MLFREEVQQLSFHHLCENKKGTTTNETYNKKQQQNIIPTVIGCIPDISIMIGGKEMIVKLIVYHSKGVEVNIKSIP